MVQGRLGLLGRARRFWASDGSNAAIASIFAAIARGNAGLARGEVNGRARFAVRRRRGWISHCGARRLLAASSARHWRLSRHARRAFMGRACSPEAGPHRTRYERPGRVLGRAAGRLQAPTPAPPEGHRRLPMGALRLDTDGAQGDAGGGGGSRFRRVGRFRRAQGREEAVRRADDRSISARRSACAVRISRRRRMDASQVAARISLATWRACSALAVSLRWQGQIVQAAGVCQHVTRTARAGQSPAISSRRRSAPTAPGVAGQRISGWHDQGSGRRAPGQPARAC